MTIPLKFRTQCARAHVSPYFFRTLSVYVFIAFFFILFCLLFYFLFYFLCSFTKITVTVRQSLFVPELSQLFYDHLAIQSEKFPNCLKRPNNGSGTSVADGRLFSQTMREIESRELSMNVIIQQERLLKNFNITISTFTAQGCGD